MIPPQLGVFAWYSAGGVAAAAGPVPVDSPLVYRPDRRRELWRFLTYSVVHAGWLHLAFNLLVQLAVSCGFFWGGGLAVNVLRGIFCLFF